MQIFGKQTARQKEIRRSKAERRLGWYHRLRERIRLQPLLLLAVSGCVAAVVVSIGGAVLDYRVGQRVARDITSRVSFRVEDPARTIEMRRSARDNAEAYYTLDNLLLQSIEGKLANALRIAREQAGAPPTLRAKAAEISVDFDDAGLEEIIRLANLPDSTLYQQALERAVRTLHLQPLVEASERSHHRTGINAVLVDTEQSIEQSVPSGDLLYANNLEHVTAVATAAANEFPEPLRTTVRESLLRILRDEAQDTYRALYLYASGLSSQAAQDAERAVPTQYNEYKAGTRLADVGSLDKSELGLLREEQRHFLAPDPSMQDAQTLRFLEDVGQTAFWAQWARGLIAFLVVFGFGGYIVVAYAGALGDHRGRFMTDMTLLILLAASRAAYLYTPFPHLAVGALAFGVSLLALTSPRGPGYAAGALLVLMVTLATQQGVGLVVILVAVSLILFLGLRDVRNRGRITAVGAVAALAAVVITFLPGLIDGQTFAFIFWKQALWAGLSVLGAAFLIEGILPGIERLFGVATNMTLLEWCDPNKPVLRILAAEAPGTYNHSLLVGTLAGAAADAIGANGLLARTGAYYHDIGKVNKPQYFVENQGMGVSNRHERLSPAMSHLVIIGHVKDGIEMAKEYRIPSCLHAFIPEHHGTTLVEYFFHAATQARKPGDPEVPETQFRYPGPRPHSRETAIVMLCDGVEGAVRAMSEPTPGRIEDTVERIAQKRLMDGQFDYCDLTFRELATIRQSLVMSLSSIYHGRIAYPSGGDEEQRDAS